MRRTALAILLFATTAQAALHGYLKQSTSATILFGPIVDGTDGKTAETGLTLHAAHIEVSKNGGAFAAKNDATNPTHRSRGQYVVTLDATDTGTLGLLTVDWVDANDVLIIPQVYQIVTANWYDSMCSTDKLQVDAVEISSDATAADNLESACDGTTYNLGGGAVVAASVTGNVGGTINGLTAAALADLFDTDSTTTYAAAVAGSVVKEIADNAGGAALTEGGIADAVWNEALAGHLGAGSTGEALNAAGAAGDPWVTNLPGAYGAGSAGYIVGTYLDRAVSDTNDPTAAAIADAVWDEVMSGHTGETTFGGEVGTLDPNITAILADTSELQTDWTDGGRLDLLLDVVKAMTDLMAVNTTTIASATDANDFVLTAGADVNDAYWMHAIMVEDATDGHSEVRWIEEYTTGRAVAVDEPFSFTPAAADKVWILGPVYGGLLIEIRDSLGQSKIPVYYRDATGGSSAGGAGDVTYYQTDGSDP